jgi:hypothetical protein
MQYRTASIPIFLDEYLIVTEKMISQKGVEYPGLFIGIDAIQFQHEADIPAPYCETRARSNSKILAQV